MQQQQQHMEGLLEGQLDEDEQLLWSGRPIPKKQSNAVRSRNPLLIVGLVYSLVGIVMLILGFIFALALHGESGTIPATIVSSIGGFFLLLSFIFFITSSFTGISPKNQSYVITDQRVMVIQSGRTMRVTSYSLDNIKQLTRVENGDGSGTLFLTPQTTFYGAYSSNSYNSQMGSQAAQGRFMNVANVREVESILRRAMRQSPEREARF